MRAEAPIRERTPRIVVFGIGLAVAGLVLGARDAGLLQGVDLWLYDLLLASRDRAAEDPPITLIRIREDEIQRHGHPLPDGKLANALRFIASREPRAIGVDLYRDLPVGSAHGRAALAELSRATPGLVFIEKIPEPGDPGVAPPEFARPDVLAFNDLVTDPDGVLRRALLLLWKEDGTPSLSLGLRLALHQLHAEGIALTADPERPEWVRLGNTSVPPLEADAGGYVDVDVGGYQVLFDFAAGSERFGSHPLAAALEGSIPDDALRDRIVIVGTTATSVKDAFLTPLPGRPLYGIEVHAHLADQLLRWAHGKAEPLRFWSQSAEVGWTFFWSLFTAGLVASARGPWRIAAGMTGAVASFGASSWALFSAGYWVPGSAPLLAALGSGGVVLVDVVRRMRAERAAVMDLFGRFVSRGIARQLWERRAEFMDGNRPRPQRMVITAMLTDLGGYTSAAEKMEPAQLMQWVNEYMDAMTQVIESRGGFVDDYTGDGIKANFGVPIGRSSAEQIGTDARTAVRCALEMGAVLEGLDADWKARGLPEARMRIGIYTGEVVVGSLGSRERMKYTTVGDTVNTAARLESFRKEDFAEEMSRDGTAISRVIVGGSTYEHLGDEFVTEYLGDHLLRGRSTPVPIYRVFAEEPEKTGSQ